MVKALGLLVVSMTATTVLLSRLEPAASHTLAPPFPEETQQSVRSAVASAETIVPNTWSGVEILRELEVTGYRREALTAPEDSGACHFWIGNGGEASASHAWSAQSSGSVGGVIRITLAGREAGSAILPSQWVALRTLLVELKDVLDPIAASGARVWPVTLSDEAARDTTLRARLRSEGLLG